MIILLLFATIFASSVRRVVLVGNSSPIASVADLASMISKAEKLVQDGDIIARDYVDPLSQAIKRFNRIDPSYSHAGIVIIENGYPLLALTEPLHNSADKGLLQEDRSNHSNLNTIPWFEMPSSDA